MKHLKVTAHQPSKNIQDRRMLFEDYKQCYTCKMDFDGFYNLMNHRKSVHPSNKQCRKYLADGCTFGDDCWYVHNEVSKPEETFDNFKCDLCKKDYKGRANFMRHKKLIHSEFVPSCEKFSVGKCTRGEKECWFEHKAIQNLKVDDKSWPKIVQQSKTKPDASSFREATGHTFPPDQMNMMMGMISNLCSKMQKMEEKFEDLMS